MEFYRALLATLSVVNYTVAFEPGTLTYGIQVESAVESIQLTAALTAADVPLVALSAQDRNGQVGFCRHWFPATGDLGYRGGKGHGRVRIQVHADPATRLGGPGFIVLFYGFLLKSGFI